MEYFYLRWPQDWVRDGRSCNDLADDPERLGGVHRHGGGEDGEGGSGDGEEEAAAGFGCKAGEKARNEGGTSGGVRIDELFEAGKDGKT